MARSTISTSESDRPRRVSVGVESEPVLQNSRLGTGVWWHGRPIPSYGSRVFSRRTI
jgi:hypothetical protein